ncbi:DoxX family protein [Paenibacillus koleovorans]|uniref:DoxX family protein n=1 Tax=Paenibacillus koleovorans TaxID=121608 RepID=UPI0027D7D6D5|nr:hypothetical protein [Paenibacillus koleovorans]
MLIFSYILFRLSGWLGVGYFEGWLHPLQAAVAAMLLLTASAHWGMRRADLIRMVPRFFPKPALLVTLTGWLELAGAVGLLIPATSQAASIGLATLLVAMFPANIRAARENLTIGGKPTPGLAVRTVLQLIFLTAVLLAGNW